MTQLMDVIRISSALCSKHQERLQCLRNYNSSFVQGIAGTTLKKDNARKHGNSDIHHKACDIERSPATTLLQIYCSSPLGKAVASAILNKSSICQSYLT